MIVDWNGRLVEEREACIGMVGPPTTFSDGLYETMRCYEGNVFDLDSHLRRLAEGCKVLHIAFEVAQVRWKSRIHALLAANELSDKDARLRIMVHRHISWESANPVNVAIMVWPVASAALVAQKARGIAVVAASQRRGNESGLWNVKSLNLLAISLAQQEAKSVNADDALFFNTAEQVCEATYGNLFIMTPDDRLLTPPISSPCLPGATRAHVLRLAKREGWVVNESSLTMDDLHAAKELFLTSSVSELMPVVKLNGRAIGEGVPGPACRLLQAKYSRLVVEMLAKTPASS